MDTFLLKDSGLVRRTLVAAHLLAVALLFTVNEYPLTQVGGLLGVAFSAWYCGLAGASSRRQRITGLRFRADGQLEVRSDGIWREAELHRESCVTRSACALSVRVSGERIARHALVGRDALGADEYRRLCVRMRWGRQPAIAGFERETG